MTKPKARNKEYDEKVFYDGLFARVHQAGVSRHARRWFIANDKAAFALTQVKGRADDPMLKALVSLVVLRVLDAVVPKEQR